MEEEGEEEEDGIHEIMVVEGEDRKEVDLVEEVGGVKDGGEGGEEDIPMIMSMWWCPRREWMHHLLLLLRLHYLIILILQ